MAVLVQKAIRKGIYSSTAISYSAVNVLQIAQSLQQGKRDGGVIIRRLEVPSQLFPDSVTCEECLDHAVHGRLLFHESVSCLLPT